MVEMGSFDEALESAWRDFREALAAEVDAGHLVVAPTTLDLERPLTAVWRKGARLSPATSALLAVAAGE